MATLHIHPDVRAALEAAGLATFDALFAAGQSGRVDGHAERSVSRLELGGASGRIVIYLKRQWGRAAVANVRDLVRLRWPAVPAHRELKNAQRLIRAGIPTAEPVIWGEGAGPAGLRTLLAFRGLEGPSLARWLAESVGAAPTASAARLRHAVARAVGQAVRRLHDSGFSFPDLYGKHLFLENLAAGRPRVVLIDPQRLQHLWPGMKATDLAALHVSTARLGVTRTDRLRVLLAYLGVERLGGSGRLLIRRIDWAAGRMYGRGQDPNLLPARRLGIVQERLSATDGGRLRVAASVLPTLQAAGLATLDALMQFSGGKVYRHKDGRSTLRVELADPAGKKHVLFIKRHTRVPLWLRLRRLIALNPPVSLAEAEARSTLRLTDRGIPTMQRLAVGEEFPRGGWGERSCLVTGELTGAVETDGYCEKTFAGALSREALAAKRQLIGVLARIARRFHGGRMTHRDFYLCHFLLRPADGAEPVLYLIDLQRVIHHKRGIPRRWLVKDLGSLLFSSWPGPGTRIRSRVFTRTDAMRFAHEYFGVRCLTAGQKQLVRAVLVKARLIARREQRRRRQGKIA